MESVFSNSEQEPLDTNNMACSILAYIDKNGNAMLETFWSNEDEDRNIESLLSLICSIKHGSFIESGLASAIESYKDDEDQQTFSALCHILDKYNAYTKSINAQSTNKKNGPVIRPLLAK